MKYLLIALCFLSLQAGCAGSLTPIPNSESGRAMLYVKRCSTCHSTPHPKRHRYGEWKVIVDTMEVHMRERGILPLSNKERASILGYLESHSR